MILDKIALLIGYFSMISISVLIILLSVRYHISKNCVSFKIFGFGFIVVSKYSNEYVLLNNVRKTENKRFFLTAPTWFNQKVYNIGGTK